MVAKKSIIVILSLLLISGFVSAYDSCSNLPDDVRDMNGIQRTCQEFSTCENLEDDNTYYLLMADLSAPHGCLEVKSENCVLDLNGYKITYADVGYDGLANHDFEFEDPENAGMPLGWDLTQAPNAWWGQHDKIYMSNDRLVTVFNNTGTDYIISDWIDISETGIEYAGYANPMLCDKDKFTVFVENSSGDTICWGDQEYPNKNNLCIFTPQDTGMYRLKIAVSNISQQAANWPGLTCYLDLADIRPYSATGVHLDHNNAENVIVRNGHIKSAGHGSPYGSALLNFGVDTGVLVEYMHLEVSGVSESAFAASENYRNADNALLRHNTFESDSAYVFNRHSLANVPVNANAENYTFINNTFLGGQGGLTLNSYAKVYNNTFNTRPRVTNHYGINTWYPQHIEIVGNKFIQEGPGILISEGTKNVVIRDNFFNLTAIPCNGEYYRQYTTSAIRITDYGQSDPGSQNENILVENNTIFGRAFKYPDHPECTPAAIGFHLSSRGTNNMTIQNNHVEVITEDELSDAFAIYGGGNLPLFSSNNLASSNYIGYIANNYATTSRMAHFDSDTFRRLGEESRWHTHKMGYWGGDCTNNTFLNITCIDCELEDITTSGGNHHIINYTIKWYAVVTVLESPLNPEPVEGALVEGYSDHESVSAVTDEEGNAVLELTQRTKHITNGIRHISNPDDPQYFSITEFTPHMITAELGELNNGVEANMVMSRDVTIYIDPGQKCDQNYNYEPCDQLSVLELSNAIQAWYTNNLGMKELLDHILVWKNN